MGHLPLLCMAACFFCYARTGIIASSQTVIVSTRISFFKRHRMQCIFQKQCSLVTPYVYNPLGPFLLQEAMMDHSLQMISYIADIGSIVVLMARRKLAGRKGQDSDPAANSSSSSSGSQKKCCMICHVFSSEDVSPFGGLAWHRSLGSEVYYSCDTALGCIM